ncbi:GH17984 [Drosophila grimshawi]|uniref:GH17984 n=1 Tax=Drosophila grimshawi TaxID=7222 RepID=B4K2V4_DROGR|nr:GH17984 [Drosophila grimshawi]
MQELKASKRETKPSASPVSIPDRVPRPQFLSLVPADDNNGYDDDDSSDAETDKKRVLMHLRHKRQWRWH